MLGGIDNGLFLQAISGFLVLAIFILILKWAFPTKKDPAEKKRHSEFKASLRQLMRK
jgi:uncharacterized membrane protein required for colicin V production